MRISFDVYKNSKFATVLSAFGSIYQYLGYLSGILIVIAYIFDETTREDMGLAIFIVCPVISIFFVAIGKIHIKLAEQISEFKCFLVLVRKIKELGLERQISISVDAAEQVYDKCPNYYTKKYLLKLNPDFNYRLIEREKQFRERLEECRSNAQNERNVDTNNKNKRKVKKILLIIGCIVLFFILIIFSAVIFSDESDINSSTYDDIGDLKTGYTTGYTVDECYFNEWCKIKFQIPDGWSMVEDTSGFDDENLIATALSYENEHDLVSMYFDHTIGNNTTIDDYLLAIEEQLKDDYRVNGITVDSTEIYDLMIADANFRTIKISLADGMYNQYFCARKIDNCMILIDVFSESIIEAEKIFDMFEYFDG